ncbi:hypothetical protein PV327_008850 [Microctonus hyperodae]|uniref:Uncharacterized protein n=1 Tax=Microctonus hyperodae TaxID=165561 RepID=A0AA39FT66_MICHY|nr:hypothetical protein PV327_008850 [Microctonus hyperodae]
MKKEIPLIGLPMPKIRELKLPTLKEVMCVFFYQLHVLKHSIKQSAKNAVDQVVKLWEKNHISTSRSDNIVKKILRCHSKWLKLQKNFKRKKSPAQKQKEAIFQSELKMLLDIADKKSLEALDDRTKNLYLNQKNGIRKEFIHNNVHTSDMSENQMQGEESNPSPPSSSCQTIIASENSESLPSQSLSEDTNFDSDLDYDPQIQIKQPKINILTPELISALDRANVSSRNAISIITPILSSVGIKIENTTLSYRTIQRTRMMLRKDIAQGVTDDFKTHDEYVVQ